MTHIVLDSIPFVLDLEQLHQRLHIQKGSPSAVDLAGEAQAIGRPKALYQPFPIEIKSPSEVILHGITLTSRILRVNLDSAELAYPFIATCGIELETWSNKIEDFLVRFWADAIKEQALNCAFCALEQHMSTHPNLGHTSMMNPGSLEDWPLTQQRPLFAILGDPQALIGVQLSDSCLMIPNKSVSGICFPTNASFESCQLCPRENCQNRRAPYDESLFSTRYQMTS